MPRPYFQQLAGLRDPGHAELQIFVDGVVQLLQDLIEDTVMEEGDREVSEVFQAVRRLA